MHETIIITRIPNYTRLVYYNSRKRLQSGQFSQSQLCPYSNTYCNDSGLGASDNVTYRCLWISGFLVAGNISTQYFYSDICVAPINFTSTTSSTSPAMGIVTTTLDTEVPPVVIALFGITMAIGLVAICLVALNVVLLLKKLNVSQSRMRE